MSEHDWLDTDGYPTDAACASIAVWKPGEGLEWWVDAEAWRPLFAFIKAIWWMADWGWIEDKNGRTFAISTGGWSGNESLITAMQENVNFWHTCWRSTRRGGHYIFTLPERPMKPPARA